MKFNVSVDYLDPITMRKFEHVSIKLPCGLQVTVFSDKIYVATAEEVFNHKDGKKIWTMGTFGVGDKKLYDEGFKAGQEDFAIGAGWAPASDTLGKDYQYGYSNGFFQAANDDEFRHDD